MKTVFINKSVILCVMMLMAYCVNSAAQDFEFNGIDYSINDDHKTVTVIGNEDVDGILNIPTTVTYNAKTYSVTAIGYRAFDDCSGLTQVIIPNSVTEIDKCAFSDCGGLISIIVASDNPNYDSRDNCNAIIETKMNTLIAGCKNSIIPNSVTKIGDEAFFGCTGLASVTIPNSVTKIGDFAFYGCSGLTQLNIPNSVTEIGEWAFSDCRGLTQLIIPNSVTDIEESAFSGCSGLTSISVASDNPNYNSRNNCNAIIETETNTLIAGCKNTFIPNSVTVIGKGAFRYCSSLNQVNIPKSVTKINEAAFMGCSDLLYVIIPNSVTKIGVLAFYGCSGLTQMRIPNSVIEIGKGAFWECSGLTQLIIPNSVIYIGSFAFDDCSSLTQVTVPKWLADDKNEMERVFPGFKGSVNVNK